MGVICNDFLAIFLSITFYLTGVLSEGLYLNFCVLFFVGASSRSSSSDSVPGDHSCDFEPALEFDDTELVHAVEAGNSFITFPFFEKLN